MGLAGPDILGSLKNDPFVIHSGHLVVTLRPAGIKDCIATTSDLNAETSKNILPAKKITIEVMIKVYFSL